MWNDTDVPLGYLITFRCYGTWLHGDDRGSIDRFHNRYQSPYLPPSSRRQRVCERLRRSKPVTLNAEQRQSVESSVRDVCAYRNWWLHTQNVRTNHVHVVVSIGTTKPGSALNAFKAYSTRGLRRAGLWKETHSPWADRGSKRHLWSERSIAQAIGYVDNGQGGPLPNFD